VLFYFNIFCVVSFYFGLFDFVLIYLILFTNHITILRIILHNNNILCCLALFCVVLFYVALLYYM